MADKIKFNELDVKGGSGNQKIKCPNCADEGKTNNKNFSVHVGLKKGKCHRCGLTVERESFKKAEQIVVPPQDWQNYTTIGRCNKKIVNVKHN